MSMATPWDSANRYSKNDFDPLTVKKGQAFHHDEFKWVRFVTFYQGDAWFEYWQLEKLGKVQKLGIFDIRDNWKRFPEKDYIDD